MFKHMYRHMVLPEHYGLIWHLWTKTDDPEEIALLRAKARSFMEEKSQLDDLHKIDTVLCPSFRQLRMLSTDDKHSVLIRFRSLLAEIYVETSVLETVQASTE